jgi:predicted metalloendopeptidase
VLGYSTRASTQTAGGPTPAGHGINPAYFDTTRAACNQFWWTAADASEYNKRAAIVVDQYNHDLVTDTLHLNGQQTLGENIADIGGLKLAYAAMEHALQGRPRPVIDGFTPEQRQATAALVRPDSTRAQIW